MGRGRGSEFGASLLRIPRAIEKASCSSTNEPQHRGALFKEAFSCTAAIVAETKRDCTGFALRVSDANA